MRSELHRVDGPWPAKLAIGPRPRGGDWPADEVADWGRAGVGEVVSLLNGKASGYELYFVSYPRPPGSEFAFRACEHAGENQHGSVIRQERPHSLPARNRPHRAGCGLPPGREGMDSRGGCGAPEFSAGHSDS